MSDLTAFLAAYQGKLDQLKAMTEHRLKTSDKKVQTVFSQGLSDVTRLSVLLDHDLTLIAAGRHPAGKDALLEVAHHALLLHLAREAEAAERFRRQVEAEIIRAAEKEAVDEIQAIEDKAVFADLDQAVKNNPAKKVRAPVRPKGHTKRPAKGPTPKRRKP